MNLPPIVILLCVLHCACAQEVRTISQCFKSVGIPKVSFSCPSNKMIKIQRAFHGIAVYSERLANDPGLNRCVPGPGSESRNCTYCEGDCQDESMNLVYDWSTCMGNASCARTVMQSYMPACQGGDKFSDYLQVEYQCVPRASVIDICSNYEGVAEEGYIMSPLYPEPYPTNQDCICDLETSYTSSILLSFYDLLLETKGGRCRADWLMIRQGDQKHRHCGAIMTGTKNLTTKTNSVALQFHADSNDSRKQTFQYFSRTLKGFWLSFKASPSNRIRVHCRRPNAAEVREVLEDDGRGESDDNKDQTHGEVDVTQAVTTHTEFTPHDDGKGKDVNGTDKSFDDGQRESDSGTGQLTSYRGLLGLGGLFFLIVTYIERNAGLQNNYLHM